MLKPEKLDALFQLLEEMTLHTRKGVMSKFSQWMQSVEKWLMLAFAVAMVVLVVMVVWYRFGARQPMHGLPPAIGLTYVIGMLFGGLYMLTAVVDIVNMIWRFQRKRFTTLLAPLKDDLSRDANFLARLQHFDKPTLEYALIQYRHNGNVTGGRIALLAGDIRKIGLFPALTTAAMAAATLLKDTASHPFLWAPLVVACCFYLVGAVAIGQRERIDQVIALIEYAIGHANDIASTRHSKKKGAAAPFDQSRPRSVNDVAAQPATTM